ncbi:hypothetical protein EMIHUDRAFT_219119 [Emiliania huxleyi CCMP1516]|uniref:Glutathione peroxidase n=2 Tax=Emiliania huxleyi TaxID=2903 RepID=A0A0D3I5Q4_EMIH1|nr:hypothetical protein EMIHUDRAFT_219119 [Emiliania huxleyi CCMP1516]EOD06589.1 hypothetical protein EMIHUDRAFT_219119 [Emiliania huxleyi CCMP1516]|eukprot:XP_005759018.1 hypothetical protein EMIHUDRAFT_219119 [Emiliania huxleyi CCMP1516]
MRHGWKSFALTACTPLGLPTDGGGCTLMAKVEVNGGREDPVWTFLKAGGKDVSWNFAAFFVVVGRFSSRELDACGEALAVAVAA